MENVYQNVNLEKKDVEIRLIVMTHFNNIAIVLLLKHVILLILIVENVVKKILLVKMEYVLNAIINLNVEQNVVMIINHFVVMRKNVVQKIIFVQKMDVVNFQILNVAITVVILKQV